jgi:C-terminal processing protease CtpA/Prc
MTFQDDGTIEEFYGQPDRTNFHSEKDSNFEHITVVAQSGVLGIVIDNPTRNIPIIHAIKETSILHGRVHVGDYLMSVDEVDCRGMTAVAVSKLIGSRSSNPTRTLKLLRGATLADVRGDSSAIY